MLHLMLYCLPVIWLLNVLHVTISWQHLASSITAWLTDADSDPFGLGMSLHFEDSAN